MCQIRMNKVWRIASEWTNIGKNSSEWLKMCLHVFTIGPRHWAPCVTENSYTSTLKTQVIEVIEQLSCQPLNESWDMFDVSSQFILLLVQLDFIITTFKYFIPLRETVCPCGKSIFPMVAGETIDVPAILVFSPMCFTLLHSRCSRI